MLFQNVKKLLWSAENLMNIDHRRRFVFALTIGGNDARIWLFCRQTLFATKPFDFMQVNLLPTPVPRPATHMRYVGTGLSDQIYLNIDPFQPNTTWLRPKYRINIS